MRHHLLLLAFLLKFSKIEGGSHQGFTPPPPSPTGEHKQPDYSKPPDPEVIKAKLSKLIDERVDRNKDGYVTVDELRDVLKEIHLEAIETTLDSQWRYFHPKQQQVLTSPGQNAKAVDVISWELYKNFTYPDVFLQMQNSEDLEKMKEMIKRLEKRWAKADSNKDNLLTREEFKDFLHPEESDRTKDIVIDEAMEDVDVDKNNEVSLEEYMEHSKNVAGEEKNDPNWSQGQQGHFVNYLDKNKDGSLNKDEFKDWILPPYDRHEAEAWRLISLADQDRDTKITKQDILNNFQFFMALQPPEFWMDDNQKRHDEF
ncbi:calumenin-like [Centruroides sculpturatus]|uniref:calumenin-like n=1 Tax=Centruroides sculpturatus TaxID=218467 RepID=UPI000C6E5450|nr:calumenin-like [Centruroides sculpturatus]